MVRGALPRPARCRHISRLFHSAKARKQTRMCSIRRLNLSCIACSLLRRSAERQRITVSSVSGWRASLTSTPSRRTARRCALPFSSSPSPRHNASAEHPSPSRRERSMRTPFSRTDAVIKQRCLFRGADQTPREHARLDPSALVELAKMRDRLLDHAPRDPNAPHQAPIAMNLPVLPANRMAQVHAPFEPTADRQKRPKVGTTRANAPCPPSNYLITLMSPQAKNEKRPQTAQGGLNY